LKRSEIDRRLAAEEPTAQVARDYQLNVKPSDPHHLRFAQSRGLGRKVSDEFTVPLCRAHHREVHRCGNEGLWWGKTRIDPLVAARVLWLETHPLLSAKATGKQETDTGRSS
jgi:hypothetical protein